MDRSKCYRGQLMDISSANKLNDPEKIFTFGIMNCITIIVQILCQINNATVIKY